MIQRSKYTAVVRIKFLFSTLFLLLITAILTNTFLPSFTADFNSNLIEQLETNKEDNKKEENKEEIEIDDYEHTINNQNTYLSFLKQVFQNCPKGNQNLYIDILTPPPEQI